MSVRLSSTLSCLVVTITNTAVTLGMTEKEEEVEEEMGGRERKKE